MIRHHKYQAGMGRTTHLTAQNTKEPFERTTPATISEVHTFHPSAVSEMVINLSSRFREEIRIPVIGN